VIADAGILGETMRRTAKRGPVLLAVAVIALAANVAHAAENNAPYDDLLALGDEVLLATMGPLEIQVQDEVKDGCWPNPAAAKEAVELEARKAGITIFEKGQAAFAFAHLRLHGAGYALTSESTKTGCVVFFEMSLTAAVAMIVPYAHLGTPFNPPVINHQVSYAGDLLVGPSGSNMQGRIREHAIEMATSIFLKILKAREKIFSIHPELKPTAAQ
jgi:hypothetical protein